MLLGCCIAPAQNAALAAAGGEYCELPVARIVMAGADSDFAALQAQCAAAVLPPRAYNVFLPGDRPVVGPDRDPAWLTNYCRTALARIAHLSGPGAIVVVGSGQARMVPAGYDPATALDQFAALLGELGSLASDYQAVIALEHLRRAETNLLTSLRACGEFLRQHQLPNVGLVADLYHLLEENEPLSVLDEFADLIVHAHVADSDRRPPGNGTAPLTVFLRRLHENGYRGNCSIECRWTAFDQEIGPAMAALRQHWAEATGTAEQLL